MTLDEWRDYKDFDMLSREMNGDFGGSLLNMKTAESSFLKPKNLNGAKRDTRMNASSISDGPKAE